MPEHEILLSGADGPLLLVRGEDPQGIHRRALRWVVEEDDPAVIRVAESPEEIHVSSIKVIGWCPGQFCECGEKTTHHITTRSGVRGAFVALAYMPQGERS